MYQIAPSYVFFERQLKFVSAVSGITDSRAILSSRPEPPESTHV